MRFSALVTIYYLNLHKKDYKFENKGSSDEKKKRFFILTELWSKHIDLK